jgi:hypothetical protein
MRVLVPTYGVARGRRADDGIAVPMAATDPDRS